MLDDPDDYRPGSRWRLLSDPAANPRVEDIAVIVEEMAIGDRVPLHIHHDVNECIVVLEGRDEVRVGDETSLMEAGDSIFIAKGMHHSQRNVGDGILKILAIFPATIIDIEMLERNPAPGTDDDPPQHTMYDLSTGEFWLRGSRD